MTQAPFQADALRVEPGSGQTLLISRDAATGSLRFRDAVVTGGVNLSELANLSTVAGTLVVGKSGTGAKYLTIQAAFNAVPTTASVTNPYVILVCPGVYTENVVWEKDGVTLLGLGKVRLVAAAATATVTIQAAVASTPHYAALTNVELENANVGGECVLVSGGASSLVGDGGVYLQGCLLVASGAGGYTVRGDTVNHLYLDGCSALGSTGTAACRVSQCATLRVTGGDLPLVQADYNSAGVTPSVVTSAYELSRCSTGNLLSTLQGVGSVSVSGCSTGTVTVNGNRTLAVDSSSLGNLVLGGTTAAELRSSRRGTVGGTGTINESAVAGTLVFAASLAETVTFGVPRTDADYVVTLDTGVPDSAYVSARLVTGFTVTFGLVQTTTVYWSLTEI